MLVFLYDTAARDNTATGTWTARTIQKVNPICGLFSLQSCGTPLEISLFKKIAFVLDSSTEITVFSALS